MSRLTASKKKEGARSFTLGRRQSSGAASASRSSARVSELEAALAEEKGKCAELEEVVRGLEGRVGGLVGAIDDSKGKLVELEGVVDGLSSDNAGLEGALREGEGEVGRLSDIVGSLEGECTALVKRIRELEGERDTLVKTVARLETQAKRGVTNCAALRAERDAAHGVCAELQETIDDMADSSRTQDALVQELRELSKPHPMRSAAVNAVYAAAGAAVAMVAAARLDHRK